MEDNANWKANIGSKITYKLLLSFIENLILAAKPTEIFIVILAAEPV